MQKLIKHKFTLTLFPIIFFAALVSILFIQNYLPGTWLSGWDTLHPEFNFPLYFKRIIYGSWQEHQGLGSSPSQAHTGELPRVIISYLLSFITPASMLRYLTFFLYLFIGVYGMFIYLRVIIFNNKKSLTYYLSSLLAASAYLLNMTMVQHMYVPLEMFIVHFATLPWLLLGAHRSLSHGGRWYLLFAVAATFSASSAHTPTLFFVVSGFLFLYVLGQIALKRNKKLLTRSILLAAVYIFVNLYWLMPTLWYIGHHADEVVQSRIHANFSEEAQLQGRAFGSWNDLVLQRNFLFNWEDYDFASGEFVDLLDEWISHYRGQPLVLIISYLQFAIVLVGIGWMAMKSKSILLSLGLLFSISALFLANNIFPGNLLFDSVLSINETLKESLRFPFTKFSIIYIFSVYVFFAMGFGWLLSKLKGTGAKVGAFIFSLGLIMGMVWPMFTGNLISPNMKVDIPQEYFKMFDWFESKGEGAKVVKLPIHTFWGWTYHDWGYQGAGFIWFGIQQPTFDREFDRWNKLNETFYNQLSYALYLGDPDQFRAVLEKYKISYLVWDRSVVDPGVDGGSLNADNVSNILSDARYYQKVSSFGDFLDIYKVSARESVFAPTKLSLVNADQEYTQQDIIYSLYGNYISEGLNLFPFSNLDHRNGVGVDVGDRVKLHYEYPAPVEVQKITVPAINSQAKIPINIGQNGNELQFVYRSPTILVNGKQIFGFEEMVGSTILPEEGDTFPISIGGDITSSVVSDNESSFLVDMVDDVAALIYESLPSISTVGVGVEGGILRFCDDKQSRLQLKSEGDRYLIEVNRDRNLCLVDELKVATDSLLVFNIEAESEGVNYYLCLRRGGSEECLGQKEILNSFGGSGQRYQLAVEPGIYEVYLVFRKAQFEGAKVILNKFSLDVHAVIEAIDLELSSPQIAKINMVDVGEKVRSVSLVFDKYRLANEKITQFRGFSEANNCGFDDDGMVLKVIRDAGAIYWAESNGVNCDFFEYRDVSLKDGSLLHIIGENMMGRGLKYYLYNQFQQRTEFEETIPFDGKYHYYHFNYPRVQGGQGYTLNVETRSFGELSSQNLLSEVEFLYLPINWLRLISLDSVDQVTNSINIDSVVKHSPTKYSLQAKGSGYFVLDQGHEPGWSAHIKGSRGDLTHHKFNSWANAWKVNDGDCVGECEVVIVYKPQSYIWIGYVVAILGLLGVVVLSTRK